MLYSRNESNCHTIYTNINKLNNGRLDQDKSLDCNSWSALWCGKIVISVYQYWIQISKHLGFTTLCIFVHSWTDVKTSQIIIIKWSVNGKIYFLQNPSHKIKHIGFLCDISIQKAWNLMVFRPIKCEKSFEFCFQNVSVESTHTWPICRTEKKE